MAESEASSAPSGAAASPSSSTLTTFTLFPKLPRDVQKRILTMAIDVDAPRAYNVNFTVEYTGPNGRTMKWGLRRVRQPVPFFDCGVPVDEVPVDGVTRNVMRTNVLARDVAKLRWQAWEPVEAFSLEERIHIKQPQHLEKNESSKSKRIVVDAANDLMILTRVWPDMTFPAWYTHIRLPHHLVAQPWKSRQRGPLGPLTGRAKALLPLFPDIKVLYVIIDEDEDLAEMRSVSPAPPYLWALFGGDAVFDWYKQALTQNDFSPTYRLKEKVYREFKPEEFPRHEEFIVFLRTLQKICEWHTERNPNREEPLVIRILSWYNEY
ncbi:hypothetical protein ACHAPT_001484 [Fusarium lateritium]